MTGFFKTLFSGMAVVLAFGNATPNILARNGGEGDKKVNPVLSFDFTQAELDAADGDGFAPSVGDAKYTLKFRDHWQPTGHVLDHYSFIEGGGIDFRQSTDTWDNSERMLAAMDLNNDIFDDINKDFTMSFDIIIDQKGSDDWANILGQSCNGTAANMLAMFAGKQTTARLACGGNCWNALEYANKGYDSNSGLQETGWVANEFNHVVVSVNPTNKRLKSWCNGVLTVDKEISESFTTNDSKVSFAIGGEFNGAGGYYGSAAVKNLDFYDFAVTNDLVAWDLNTRGYVYESDLANQKAIDPMAKYEFNDAENPGKDSMGKYDLEKIGTAAGITAADGVLTLDGTGALASPFTNDLSDAIADHEFTMFYDGKSNATYGFLFSALSDCYGGGQGVGIQANSSWYRSACSDSTGCVAGDNNDWGKEIAKDQNPHKIAVVKDTSSVKFYCDGDLAVSYTIAGMNLSSSGTRFTIGGQDWNYLEYLAAQTINEFRVYDIALTADEVKELTDIGEVYENAGVTVESIAELDWTNKIVVPADATDEEILNYYAPEAHAIDVTMSNGSAAKGTVTWNKVVRGETLKLEGTVTGVINENDVKAYATIGTKADCVAIQPIAKYNFSSTADMCKDETGRFPLSIDIKKHASQDEDGNTIYVENEGVTPTAENGAVVFDGNYSLYNKDLGKYLGTTATVSYDIELTGVNDDWATPVGFGQNGWNATSFAKFQFSGASDLLRLAIGNKDENSGNSTIANMTGNGYWGAEISSLSTTKHNVTLVLNDAGNVRVYVDSVKKFDAAQNGFTLDFTDSIFCIGGVYNYSQYIKNCKVSNVSVYDFAATAEMVKVLNGTGAIKTNQYTGTYVTEIGNEAHFEGEKVIAEKVRTENTDAEVIAKAKATTVTAKLSDNNTKELSVKWVSVDWENSKLVGKVQASTEDHLEYACATDVTVYAPIEIEEKLTVTVFESQNGTVTADVSEDYAGTAVTLTVTPAENYQVASVKVNGVELAKDAEGAYKFTLSENATVTATFEAIPQPEPEPEPEEKTGCGGSVLAASALVTLISFAGLAFIAGKKRKED